MTQTKQPPINPERFSFRYSFTMPTGGQYQYRSARSRSRRGDPHRVFEAFFSTKRNYMGMGLAICRSIINGHDGQLWAENEDGGGAAFTFTLPFRSQAAGNS